ncbi:MAG: class I SAM-dependent methyltransferase [candidate division NC10 bacterium]
MTATTESGLAGYYAKRAAEYERIFAKPERQADLTVLRARLVVLFAGRSVLELACGTGWWTALIAPHAAHVTALDVNDEVLAIARAKPLPPGRVEFVLGDAYAPPDLRATHDALFAGFWWSHVPKARLDAFLADAARAVACQERDAAQIADEDADLAPDRADRAGDRRVDRAIDAVRHAPIRSVRCDARQRVEAADEPVELRLDDAEPPARRHEREVVDAAVLLEHVHAQPDRDSVEAGIEHGMQRLAAVQGDPLFAQHLAVGEADQQVSEQRAERHVVRSAAAAVELDRGARRAVMHLAKLAHV